EADQQVRGAPARRAARGRTGPDRGGGRADRLRAERLPGAGPPAGRVPGVRGVPRRAAGQGDAGAVQGRPRDGRGRHQRRQRLHLLRGRARGDPPDPGPRPAAVRPGGDELPAGRHRAPAAGDARLRAAGRRRAGHRRGRAPGRAAPVRVRHRRRVGHRRDRGAVRPVEPAGPPDGVAAEPGVRPARPGAADL
ncbi:MAG: Bll3817 protein, partial [uncultured Corynebacteriales bacterium]